MYEGIPGYAESATTGLNGGFSGKINPAYGSGIDFGNPDNYKHAKGKFGKILGEVLEIERRKLRGEYGDVDSEKAENAAIDALKNLLLTL